MRTHVSLADLLLLLLLLRLCCSHHIMTAQRCAARPAVHHLSWCRIFFMRFLNCSTAADGRDNGVTEGLQDG
jgi:hypothetical protein